MLCGMSHLEIGSVTIPFVVHLEGLTKKIGFTLFKSLRHVLLLGDSSFDAQRLFSES